MVYLISDDCSLLFDGINKCKEHYKQARKKLINKSCRYSSMVKREATEEPGRKGISRGNFRKIHPMRDRNQSSKLNIPSAMLLPKLCVKSYSSKQRGRRKKKNIISKSIKRNFRVCLKR